MRGFAPTAIRHCSSAFATRRAAIAEAKTLTAAGADGRPLYGIPVAIKDNIDAEGMPTTAACPAFAYKPAKDATAVARLRRAGAIVIGKTNLDQFATGLVGVRSPYGIPRNAFDPALIPGGSSSGSAVAVAAGLVPLALGTDTAGSGRVPAGLNNIVGLKPSLGLISTAGVVPACRSLDCVSIFALTTDDCWTALAAIAGPDAADPYSRSAPARRRRLLRQGRAARRADRRAAHVLRRSRRGQRLRRGDRARGRARRADRRSRHRAVLRDGAAALRRALGGGALYRAQVAAGVVAGLDPSRHPGHHRQGRAAERRRYLRGVLRA